MSDSQYIPPRATLVGMPHRDRPADMTLKNIRDEKERKAKNKLKLKEMLKQLKEDITDYEKKKNPKSHTLKRQTFNKGI